MSTKIHTLVDALGNPTAFHLTPAQHHDIAGTDALIPGSGPRPCWPTAPTTPMPA